MNQKLTKENMGTIEKKKRIKNIPYHLFFLSVLEEVRKVVELTSTCAKRRERWLMEEDIRSRSYRSECGFFKYRASLTPRLSG